ncbi:hypothetical protein HDU85_005349 [Gaertneriomyces sp. JEL0708]|nr:hypothetical protein HDU85_005349 [Gaertneriomyces sp. JEL0708]
MPTITSLLQSLTTTLFYTSLSLLSGGLLLLYAYQNTLIYPAHFPPGSRVEVAKPSDFRVEYEDLTIRTEDGELLKGYLIPHKLNGVRRTTSSDDVVDGGMRMRRRASNPGFSSAPDSNNNGEEQWAPITLLYCHANAGNMGHRLPIALALQRRYPVNLVMYSYRGYGLSTGSPSENGLKTDTRAVMEFMKSHEKLSKTKIVIYGQSLGGAVAVYAASAIGKSSARESSKKVDSTAGSQLDIAGLILENTFLSLPSLVPSIMPFTKYLPIKLLLTQIWDTQSLCRSLPPALPILLLSGSKDELVPPHHMRGLWETLVRQRDGSTTLKEPSQGSDRRNTNEEIGLQDFLQSSSQSTDHITLDTETNVTLARFRDGTHNETCMQKGYFTTIVDFLNTLVQQLEAQPGETDSVNTATSDSMPLSDEAEFEDWQKIGSASEEGGITGAADTVRRGGAGAFGTAGLAVPDR